MGKSVTYQEQGTVDDCQIVTYASSAPDIPAATAVEVVGRSVNDGMEAVAAQLNRHHVWFGRKLLLGYNFFFLLFFSCIVFFFFFPLSFVLFIS
jgi:hypothetical protein